MAVKNLESLIENFEKENDIIRVKEFFSPVLEITDFAERMMKSPKGGKALLFENTGTDFPVLINHYGSDNRMCKTLGIKNYDEPGERMEELFQKFIKPADSFISKLSLLPQLIKASGWMPKKIKGKGICQQVIMSNPDLEKLPILKCWPLDGGAFITLPMVITEDPETGIRNIGMYRMQVYNNKSTGMHWHLHKGGAAHYEKFKKLGKKMPVSVAIGGDPALTYSSTAPLPENVDEFMLAGFLRNESVKLVKSITNDIYVPNDADFIIEGYIDTKEDLKIEGPFGDHTGFYSLKDYYPIFHITAITHKKNAIYPATVVGIPPMEDFYIGKATERIFLKPIQISIAPEILDIRLPGFGVAHNLVLVKAKIDYPGQSFKIMNALLGAGQMMFTKVIICFDQNVDIHNDNKVFEALVSNSSINEDIHIGKGPSDVLDHSAYTYTFSGKLIIDATSKKRNKNYQLPINSINTTPDFKLLYNQLGVCVIKVDKSKYGNLKAYAKKMIVKNLISDIKALVLIDYVESFSDNYLLLWYILSNIDPSKDCEIIDNILVIDASIKNKNQDSFYRDWPNVVCMDDETINKVDKLWEKVIGLPIIESPSKTIFHFIGGDKEIFDIS